MPPMEKPSTSTLVSPRALMKAMALAPISCMLVGTLPELFETPALLKRITSRFWPGRRLRPDPNNPWSGGNAG